MAENRKNNRSGPEAKRLKIDGDWKDAVRQALDVKPEGDVSDSKGEERKKSKKDK